MATPSAFWKPAANTSSHSSGRTSDENSLPGCRKNLCSSRPATARKARQAWIRVVVMVWVSLPYLPGRHAVSAASAPSVSR